MKRSLWVLSISRRLHQDQQIHLHQRALEAGCKESVDPTESVSGTGTESVASPEQRPYITWSGRSAKPPARYRDMGK